MKNLLLICLIAVLSSTAHSNEMERRHLDTLRASLESLRYLIDKARSSQSLESEYQIDYDLLEKEFSVLINGIAEVVEAPRREPRKIHIHVDGDSVQGEYLP